MEILIYPRAVINGEFMSVKKVNCEGVGLDLHQIIDDKLVSIEAEKLFLRNPEVFWSI